MAANDSMFSSNLFFFDSIIVNLIRKRCIFLVARRAVAFGTTLDRELLPLKVPANRFGNELGLRGAPNRGPGCYDNAEVTNNIIANLLLPCVENIDQM